MQKRTIKVALLAVLAIVLVLGICTAALADQTWRDLPDTVTAKYGVTDNQISAISEGYSNGLWRPFSTVSRAQFTKMAVAAFNIPLASPAIAAYTDVPKGSFYYPYVEGAKAAGIVSGTTATTFSPNVKITRQQAIAIVARHIAKAQGFDLATMYTSDEITHLLAHFGDAANISADLRDEMAFAFDMGLTQGDDYGNLNPLANLTRIQGAALLIRAQAIAPPNLWVPGELVLTSTDKTEGLIGQTYNATFKVTTADGHPAKNVLVDFDSQMADFYVGNVDPEAQVTDSMGEVTVAMLSLEPGVQRVSATVAGLPTVYTTRYWLAIDEVYNTKGAAAQNNAGVEHQWAVRVVVMGPGPRSTSVSDWYNAISTGAFDPTDVDVEDGIDYFDYFDEELNQIVTADGWSLADEQFLAKYGFAPRTLAGINVEWAIYNKADDPKTILSNEAVTSVGNIVKVDGTSITPAKTAVGKTDIAGLSTIIVVSEAIGVTLSEAVADYPDNPYPEQLFNHLTFEQAVWWHNMDWDDQPATNALQTKTWIAHTLEGPVTAGPITPSYIAPNVGEEKTLTLTLLDVYGNPIVGKGVEWYMQGVGFFQTDDSGDTSDPEVAANNMDFDVTDAAGKAKVFLKSYDSGEQIVHAKVRDKGTGGSEGTFATYTAEVQWFDADIATFDDITTQYGWSTPYIDTQKWVYLNEALSANALGTSHTFTLSVYGLKLEYDPSVDYRDGQTPLIDSDAAGHSYDGIFNGVDAAYYGGLLMYPEWPSLPDIVTLGTEDAWDAWMTAHWSQLWGWFDNKMIDPWGYDTRLPLYNAAGAIIGYDTTPDPSWIGALPWDINGNGVIEPNAAVDADLDGDIDFYYDETGYLQFKVAGTWLSISFEGAYTMYDYNDDGYPEDFAGVPGLYLPLAGKSVFFLKANSDGPGLSNLGAFFDGATVDAVTTATPSDTTAVAAVTDSSGHASIIVQNPAGGGLAEKGPETVKATVTWIGNPHDGPELQTAYAKKNWVAGATAAATNVWFQIFIDDLEVVNTKTAVYKDLLKSAWTTDDAGNRLLSSVNVELHVYDVYGNDLPDYEVVYLLEDIDGWLGGTQDAYHTYIPFAYLTDIDPDDYEATTDSFYDTNGDAPDSDEPTSDSDPYAYIVGEGGTPAFFFNQWLGSEKPVDAGFPGLATWFARVSGLGFLGYLDDIDHVSYTYTWPRWGSPVNPVDFFNGMDLVLEFGTPLAPADLGLATDGAKAWTRDGFYIPENSEDVIPNLFTGSSLDIQLADDITGAGTAGIHVKSILRFMVYSPHDGLMKEGDYIWSYQQHVVWEEPVPTTITLAVTPDYAIAGLESQTLTATVLDQFGDAMPNVVVTVNSTALEGELTNLFSGATMLATDENGNTVIGPWTQLPGDWGVERVVATAGDATSNPALIQWIYDDTSGVDIVVDGTTYPGDAVYNLLYALDGSSQVSVFGGFTPWNGRTLSVYTSPGGAAVSGPVTYVSTSTINITTTSALTSTFFVSATNSSNSDERPNWVYDVVEPAPGP